MKQWHVALTLLLVGLHALAQPAAPGWPDTPQSREFLRRVQELAVRYGESSGLDGNGFLIEARDLGATRPGCHRVQSRISLAGVPVREESAEICKP